MSLFKTTYPKLNDEELMVQSAHGDKQAFSELYKRYADRLNCYFSSMFRFDKLKANDFTHDLFLKIIEYGRSYDKTKKFSTWIFTIAANMCKNEFRRLEHERSYHENEISPSTVHHDYTEDYIDFKIATHELKSLLNELSSESRELIFLRFHEELTIREIAEIKMLPEGTVKSRLFYTLKEITTKMACYNIKIQQ